MNYMYDTWLVAEKAFIIIFVLSFPICAMLHFQKEKMSWSFIFGITILLAIFGAVVACILFKLGVIDWKFDLIIFKR